MGELKEEAFLRKRTPKKVFLLTDPPGLQLSCVKLIKVQPVAEATC